VPDPLRNTCTTFLDAHDFVALTNEQGKQFGAVKDPEAMLEDKIADLTSSLRTFEEYSITGKDAIKWGYDRAELKSQERHRAHNIARLRLQIAQLSGWRQRLKPYLCKTVELQPYGIFGGNLFRRTLVTNVGGLGSAPRTMHACPVIAFLPYKPLHVYTAVGLID
jgi:hypothetical protein